MHSDRNCDLVVWLYRKFQILITVKAPTTDANLHIWLMMLLLSPKMLSVAVCSRFITENNSEARSIKAVMLVFRAELDHSNSESAELQQMPDWLPQCNDASDSGSSWNIHA